MKIFFPLSLLLLCLIGCSENTQNKDNVSNKIQDTDAAVQYFEAELSFTTNPYGVKSAIDKGQTITIVDVRSAADFKAGHIPGAINIPFEQWSALEGDQTSLPGLRKDGFNCVYCYELLCNLGQKAAKKFASMGYPVKEIKGGFQAWKEHKYPIEK